MLVMFGLVFIMAIIITVKNKATFFEIFLMYKMNQANKVNI